MQSPPICHRSGGPGDRVPVGDGSRSPRSPTLTGDAMAPKKTRLSARTTSHGGLSKELPRDDGWLIMTLVPNRAGDMPITRASIDEFRTWLRQRRAFEFPTFIRTATFDQVRSEFRSIRFNDAPRPDLPPYSQLGRAYGDGSGIFATKYPGDERGDFLEIEDERLLGDVIDSLLLLGAHAVERALTGGDAVVLTELLGSGTIPMVLTGYDVLPRPDQLEGSVRLVGSTPVSQRMMSLEDISMPGPALIRAARPIVADLFSCFGIPEPAQASDGGVLHLRRFSRGAGQQVRDWADSHGVAVEFS
jgi:hypothetical protein